MASTLKIKISCQNSIIKDSGANSVDGHPWRNWQISLVAMEDDKEAKGKLSKILDYVEYVLHPLFPLVVSREPYLLQEKGWGEFDLTVILYFAENLVSPQVIVFDLNFGQASYSKIQEITIPEDAFELKSLVIASHHQNKNAPAFKSRSIGYPRTERSGAERSHDEPMKRTSQEYRSEKGHGSSHSGDTNIKRRSDKSNERSRDYVRGRNVAERSPIRKAERSPLRREDRSPIRSDSRSLGMKEVVTPGGKEERRVSRIAERVASRNKERSMSRNKERSPARKEERSPLRREDRRLNERIVSKDTDSFPLRPIKRNVSKDMENSSRRMQERSASPSRVTERNPGRMPEKGIERNPSRAPERKNAEGALPRPSERTAGKETERTTVRLPERSSHQDRSLSRNEKRNPSRRDSISPVRSEEQASKKRTLSTALQEDELSQGIIRGKLSTQPDCQGVKDMRKKLKSNKEQEEKIPPIVSQNYTVYQNTETPSNKTYHSTNPITYQPLRLPSRTIGTAFSEGSSQSSTGQKPKNPASLDLLHKSDLLKAHPLHTALLNAEQRRQWDIPAINMLELGRRIMEMNAEQKRELIQLLQANAHSKIAFKTDPTTGRRLMNLYSLGTDLLQKMWDLTEDQSPVPPLHVEQLTEKDPLISLFPEFFGLVKGAEYPAVWNKFNTKKKLDKGKQPDRGEQPVTESSSSYVRRPVNERNTSYEKRPVPENKSAYEKKPSCENKTISENRPADERKSSYEKRLVPEYKPADERKPSYEKRPVLGNKPADERKFSYERKSVPEYRLTNERNYSYEKKPVPEFKPVDERKPSYEKQFVPENRPTDEGKSSYEKKPVPEYRSTNEINYSYEKKPVPEYKPVDERKSSYEKKPVPEYMPTNERNYSYEKKPVPEYKPVDERKPSYEKKFVPGNRPADERKSSYERNPVPENKTAYEKKSTNERKPATNDKYTNERRPTTAKKSVIENQPIAEKRPSAADKGKQPMTKDKGKQLFGPGEYINDSRNVLLSDSDFDSLASDIEEGLIDESAENPLDPLFGDESSEEGQIKDDDDLFPTNKNSESAQEGFINSQVVRYQVGRSKPDEEVNVHPSYPFQNRQYQLNRHLSDVASDSDDSSQYSDL